METTVIWEEFSEALKRFIYNRVKNNEVTNDLLQEVFIKIHLNIHKIKNQESIKSWIYTITINTINDYFKKQVKQNKLNSEIIEFNNKTANEHSAKDCLLPLINNLPSTYKDALLLSEINGLKQAEVAKY